MESFILKKSPLWLVLWSRVTHTHKIEYNVFERRLLCSPRMIKKYSKIQHIRMISKGSCDTENWNYDCWKLRFAMTGIHLILKYITTKQIFNCNNIYQYCFVQFVQYCTNLQINAVLVSIRDFFKMHIYIYIIPNFTNRVSLNFHS